eukprot:TRINITY_DN2316_c1_g1_i1.p1 TRINITY_DN2316_c1_g1~~TRINITY_DN2316_c1_g1_i1.p1  ORF type:complete len:343 (+),score=92.27 TRINITY_DN2316_c1_g1_i1:43-1071(+)
MNLSELLPAASDDKKKKKKRVKKKKKNLSVDLLLLNNNNNNNAMGDIDSDGDIDELENELQEKKRLQVEAEKDEKPTGISAMLPAPKTKNGEDNSSSGNVKKPHAFELREGVAEAFNKQEKSEPASGGLSLGYGDSDSGSGSESNPEPAVTSFVPSSTRKAAGSSLLNKDTPDSLMTVLDDNIKVLQPQPPPPPPPLTVQQLQQQQRGSEVVVEAAPGRVIKKATFTFKNRAKPKPREDVILTEATPINTTNNVVEESNISIQMDNEPPTYTSPPPSTPGVIHISQAEQLSNPQSYAPLVRPTVPSGKAKNNIFHVAAQAAAYRDRAEYDHRSAYQRRPPKN